MCYFRRSGMCGSKFLLLHNPFWCVQGQMYFTKVDRITVSAKVSHIVSFSRYVYFRSYSKILCPLLSFYFQSHLLAMYLTYRYSNIKTCFSLLCMKTIYVLIYGPKLLVFYNNEARLDKVVKTYTKFILLFNFILFYFML